MRMFFVAERIVVDWNVARDTGLLFDRCRIMEYASQISSASDLFARIRAWVVAARKQLQSASD